MCRISLFRPNLANMIMFFLEFSQQFGYNCNEASCEVESLHCGHKHTEAPNKGIP